MHMSRRVDEALEVEMVCFYCRYLESRLHLRLRNYQSNRFEYTAHTLYPRTPQDVYFLGFSIVYCPILR